LLKRYKAIAQLPDNVKVPKPYTASPKLDARNVEGGHKILFFNLGFLNIEHDVEMSDWVPKGTDLPESQLVVVADNDIAMLHDMALYRQSRVRLEDDMKKVAKGAFFNVEALPEGCVLVFPVALKETGWQPFGEDESTASMYFGGLESVGFGRCQVTLGGEGFTSSKEQPQTEEEK